MTIKDLTLTSAVETAHTYEAAYKDAKALKGGSGSGGSHEEEKGMFKLSGFKGKDGDRRECFRCGALTHLANKCPFSKLECFKCGKTGHKANKCFPGGKKDGGILKKKDSGGDGKTVRFVNRVSGLDEVEDDDCEEFDFLSIHRMSRMGRNEDFEDPVMVGMNINGKQASLELDTGAVVTVMRSMRSMVEMKIWRKQGMH